MTSHRAAEFISTTKVLAEKADRAGMAEMAGPEATAFRATTRKAVTADAAVMATSRVAAERAVSEPAEAVSN